VGCAWRGTSIRICSQRDATTGGRAALREALAEAGLDCLTGGVDDPLAPSPGLACIDHICVGGLRAIGSPRSSVCPRPGESLRGLTDHYCTWVDVDQPRRNGGILDS
jgi:hypothetical protein